MLSGPNGKRQTCDARLAAPGADAVWPMRMRRASGQGAKILAASAGLAVLVVLGLDRRRHDAQLADLGARLDAMSFMATRRAATTRESRPQMTWQAMRDRYDRVFDSSLPDKWATEYARTAVWSKLVSALPTGSAVRAFECRGAMCRLETSHVDLAHYKTFMVTAFQNPSTRLWQTEATSMPRDEVDDASSDGPKVMVSFIARDGLSLPALTD